MAWNSAQLEKCILPRLFYPEIRFFHGETVSPEKLEGIFALMRNSAFYSLELILGNIRDFKLYKPEDLKDKRGVLNVASALGHMGNVYKPYNLLNSITDIYRRFGSPIWYSGKDVTGRYTNHYEHIRPARKALTGELLGYYEIVETINIPVAKSFEKEVLIGLHFSCTDGDPTITIYGDHSSGGAKPEETPGVLVSAVSLGTLATHSEAAPGGNPALDTLPIPTHYSTRLTPSTSLDGVNDLVYVSHIELNPNGSTSLGVHSLYCVEIRRDATIDAESITVVHQGYESSRNSDYEIPLNKMYSPNMQSPKNQNVCVRVPCKWATMNKCSKSVGSFCIGNTYDIYLYNSNWRDWKNYKGVPVCAGLAREDGSGGVWRCDSSLIPKSIDQFTDNGIDYEIGDPLNYEPAPQASNATRIRVAQSCLLMEDKPFALKYHPVAFTDENIRDKDGNIIIEEMTPLDKNRFAIYDTKSTLDPIFTEKKLLTSNLPHQLVIYDTITSSLVPDVADPSGAYVPRYAIIGGNYGISDKVEDVVKLQSLPNRNIAVYAD